MKMRIVWLRGTAHGVFALYALYQAASLFMQIRSVAWLEVFYLVVFLMGFASLWGLHFAPEKSKTFVVGWEWLLLVSSFLVAWLGAVPEMRNPGLVLFFFALLLRLIA